MHFFNSNFYYNAQIGAKYFPAGDGKTNQRHGKVSDQHRKRPYWTCVTRFILTHQYHEIWAAGRRTASWSPGIHAELNGYGTPIMKPDQYREKNYSSSTG